MNCDRCEKRIKKADAVPVVYGNTDMTICHPCAVELTMLIGHWLGTEPMDDPVKWYVEKMG